MTPQKCYGGQLPDHWEYTRQFPPHTDTYWMERISSNFAILGRMLPFAIHHDLLDQCLISVLMHVTSKPANEQNLRLYKGKWSWYQCTPNSLSKWADKCSKVRKNAFGLGIYAKSTCHECFLNMLWVSPLVSRLLSSLKNILFVRKECVAVWEDLLAWLVTEVSVDVKNLCFIIPSDERRWVTNVMATKCYRVFFFTSCALISADTYIILRCSKLCIPHSTIFSRHCMTSYCRTFLSFLFPDIVPLFIIWFLFFFYI